MFWYLMENEVNHRVQVKAGSAYGPDSISTWIFPPSGLVSPVKGAFLTVFFANSKKKIVKIFMIRGGSCDDLLSRSVFVNYTLT